MDTNTMITMNSNRTNNASRNEQKCEQTTFAIVNQPLSRDSVSWIPPKTTNFPPGLEQLNTLDHLFIKQKIDMLEATCGCSRNNFYDILNNRGLRMFTAVEENDCCTRCCFSSERPFEIKILDAHQNPLLRIVRPCTCFLDTVDVTTPAGELIGTVTRNWTCKPNFSVKNVNQETVFKIKGPMCTIACCSDVDFFIVDMKGEEVGKISKHWTSIRKEFFTSADTFGIHFPRNTDWMEKCLLIGGCFLVDFKYFEPQPN